MRHALMKHLWRCLPNHIAKFPNVNHISKFSNVRKLAHTSRAFILYIYFNGASTSPLSLCSVSDNECEEEEMIKK